MLQLVREFGAPGQHHVGKGTGRHLACLSSGGPRALALEIRSASSKQPVRRDVESLTQSRNLPVCNGAATRLNLAEGGTTKVDAERLQTSSQLVLGDLPPLSVACLSDPGSHDVRHRVANGRWSMPPKGAPEAHFVLQSHASRIMRKILLLTIVLALMVACQSSQTPTPTPIPDSDGDGLSDPEERPLGTNPLRADSDVDGLTDAAKVAGGTNPLNSETDGGGVIDDDDLFPFRMPRWSPSYASRPGRVETHSEA